MLVTSLKTLLVIPETDFPAVKQKTKKNETQPWSSNYKCNKTITQFSWHLMICSQTSISCHLWTHIICCIMANVLQTKVRQNWADNACNGRRFRFTVSYLSKVTNFNLPHLHLMPVLEWPSLSFAEIFSIRKLESFAIVWCGLHDPMFSRFNRTPTCDRQTDRHTTMAYTALAWCRVVKKIWSVTSNQYS